MVRAAVVQRGRVEWKGRKFEGPKVGDPCAEQMGVVKGGGDRGRLMRRMG